MICLSPCWCRVSTSPCVTNPEEVGRKQGRTLNHCERYEKMAKCTEVACGLDWECHHGLGSPEAESEMELSMQVFWGSVLRSTPVEWRAGKMRRGGETSVQVQCLTDSMELGEPFRAVLNWLEVAGSLILFPATTHWSVTGCGQLWRVTAEG